MTMEERVDALIAMISLRAQGCVVSADRGIVTVSSPSSARFEWHGDGWQVQIGAGEPRSVLSWEEMAEVIGRAWPIEADLTGHWVEHKAWGRAVITAHPSPCGWHSLRYQAVRRSDGDPIWVENAALCHEFEVVGDPDEESAAVLALKGPYGEGQ